MPGQVGRTHQRRRKNEGRQEVLLKRCFYEHAKDAATKPRQSRARMWAGHNHSVTLSRPCMKMDPSLHLVSDQTSAEVRGRTAEFEELVHAEHVGLFRALALITRDSARPRT